MKRRRGSLSFLVLAMTAGCGTTEPSPEPTTRTPATTPEPIAPAAATVGFRWLAATPESQGMCGSTKQLGCTRTLQQVWNGINKTIHNTKRFLVIRNDRVIFDPRPRSSPAPSGCAGRDPPTRIRSWRR